VGIATFKLQRRRKTQGTRLDLRAPQSFVLVHEDYDKAHDEKGDHCRAEKVVVAVDVEWGKVQFRGREPGVS